MQQESGESEAPDHQQQSAPLRCPRCDSTDTKFRYFNNNDRAQPRHYCKTCRRYWTVGGSMRNIPFGGSRRNGNPAKECGPSSPYSSISVSPISSSDEWEHKLQHPLMVSQNILGTTKVEHLGSLSAPIPPASSYDLNDEISCLAAIQSLMQPHVVKERDFWSMALMNQPLPQHLPSYYGGNLGHPNCPMITPNLPQDFNNSFSFSAENASIWNNSNGNTNDRETARTSMNSNGWPHLPNYLGPP